MYRGNIEVIMTREFIQSERIAYFTMEIALRADIPTYSGGLGVLAGDTVRSAAGLELPLVTVSLVSRAGYVRQDVDEAGRQNEAPDPWDPSQHARPLQAGWWALFPGAISCATWPACPPAINPRSCCAATRGLRR